MRLIEALGDIVPICQAPTMKDLELTVWRFLRGIWNECHARNTMEFPEQEYDVNAK